jgi:hypothetical protein
MSSSRIAMRLPVILMLSLAVAGCETTPIPDSGEGVGFQDYTTYQRSREATLAGSTGVVGTGVTPIAPTTGFSTAVVGAAIDEADGLATSQPVAQQPGAPLQGVVIGSTEPNRPRGNAPAGIKVEAGETAAVRAGISDENDFAAVAARETIQSDAERIAQNRAQYQVVQPGALPKRPGDTGPNIVEYALATTHAPGTQLHKRSSLRANRAAAICARYGSPDQAQEAFLAKGGPDRDRLGVDPDGDGFACGWDPRPFRTALR